MPRSPSPHALADPQTRRALELDALSAILPVDRRDRLAGRLTDDDVETLKHLAREGMGENTLRALACPRDPQRKDFKPFGVSTFDPRRRIEMRLARSRSERRSRA
jgi:hypothetical protein